MLEELKGIKESISQIGQTIHNITHPIETIKNLGSSLIDSMFFITMVACMIGIMLYLIGYNKGKKIAYGSFMLYFVISMIQAGW